MASRDRGSVTATREVRETARQALRPGREELAAGSSGGNSGNRSASLPKNATVERREVCVPSQGTRGASQAPGLPRQMRGNARGCASKTRVTARLTRQAERVFAAPVQLSALRSPRFGSRHKVKARARKRRGNEMGCLKL